MASAALTQLYHQRARQLAITEHYIPPAQSTVFTQLGSSALTIVGYSATAFVAPASASSATRQLVQRVVSTLVAQRVQPLGLTQVQLGTVATTKFTTAASGEIAGLLSWPELYRDHSVIDASTNTVAIQCAAFGITPMSVQTNSLDVTGSTILFVGSASSQPDALLLQHLTVATLDLKLAERCKIVAVTDNGLIGAALALLDGVTGYGVQLQLQQEPTGMEMGFVLAVPSQFVSVIQQHYLQTWSLAELALGAMVTVLGTINSGHDTITIAGQQVLDDQFKPELVQFKPTTNEWRSRTKEPGWTEVRELETVVLRVISHPDLAAPMQGLGQYDTTALGDTIVEAGAAAATVVAPLLAANSNLGVATVASSNARYAGISPYWQTINAIVDSVRKLVASGAQPWGVQLQYHHPKQDKLDVAFADSVRGAQMAIGQLGLQLMNQHTSWYQPSQLQAQLNPWPTMVQAIGQLVDASSAVTIDFIQPGNAICLVGARRAELGGSLLYTLYNEIGSQLPQPDLALVKRECQFMQELMQQRLVPTCHVIGAGGLVTTLATMCFGVQGEARTGITIDLAAVPGADLTVTQKLFSETGGFIFEMDSRLLASAQRHAAACQVELYPIGQIRDDELFTMQHGDKPVLSLPVGTLAAEWLRGWPGVI